MKDKTPFTEKEPTKVGQIVYDHRYNYGRPRRVNNPRIVTRVTEKSITVAYMGRDGKPEATIGNKTVFRKRKWGGWNGPYVFDGTLDDYLAILKKQDDEATNEQNAKERHDAAELRRWWHGHGLRIWNSGHRHRIGVGMIAARARTFEFRMPQDVRHSLLCEAGSFVRMTIAYSTMIDREGRKHLRVASSGIAIEYFPENMPDIDPKPFSHTESSRTYGKDEFLRFVDCLYSVMGIWTKVPFHRKEKK